MDGLIHHYLFNPTFDPAVHRIRDDEKDRHYSEDIKAAWEVVEKMRHTPCKDGDHFCFDLYSMNDWMAVFRHHLGERRPEEGFENFEYFAARAQTAPLTICRAALKALAN